METSQRELTVDVTPVGPDSKFMEQMQPRLQKNSALKKAIGGRSRVVSLELIDDDDKSKDPSGAPSRFRATLYDYEQQRALLVEGEVKEPQKATVRESARQPLPTSEEFEEAVAIIGADRDMKRALARDGARMYRPMPPLVPAELPDGRSERVVTVGILPGNGGRHEIVGVNLQRREVIRFANNAPPNALADQSICGLPDGRQPTIRNTPGQVWITVKQGRTTLWRFLAVRPAGSSGTNGSGVELRYVDYRGKRVLYRAHVPVLNVKYGTGPCGPYRDWQNEESSIEASGTDVGSGFRLASPPARTILDTGSDTGTFTGVAIYVKGQEVVLVSEMEAGWYRYISEWRLHANGTIKPRFGFSAVSSSCVCNVHYHHVYWRLDFDLRTPGNNIVSEYNSPPIFGDQKWHDKKFEIKRFRDPSRHRKWRVTNTKTKEAYEIVPGKEDGSAATSPDAPFGRGDLWVLRYHANEIDDGVVATGPPYEAPMDAWVDGESVENQDVVVWYGAHFAHDIGHEEPGEFGHIMGPDLVPVKW